MIPAAYLGAQVAPEGRGLAARLATYRSVLAMAAVAIFFTNFSGYSSVLTGGIIVHFQWMFLFLCASSLLLLGARRTDRVRLYPIHAWAYGFFVVSVLWFYPFWEQSATATQHLLDTVLAVIFLVEMTIILADPGAQRAARLALACAVLFGVGVNLYELLHPLTFSRDIGRSAGLYINSNPSAAALILGMIVAQDVVKPRYRLLFVFATGVGVLTTLSRAGMIGWVIIVVLTSFRRGRRGRRSLELCLLVLLVVGFVLSPWWKELEWSLEQRGLLTTEVRDRLDFFGGKKSLDESATGRDGAALQAWHMLVRDPWVGAGTGRFYESPFEKIGPHNMYLALMVDFGFGGAFVLPLLVFAATWRARGEARFVAVPFALFVSFWALFSHNVLEEPYMLFSFALVASMTATSQLEAVPSARPASTPAVVAA